jgi:hypothetical protein
MMTHKTLVNRFVISTFVLLYLCVSIISTIHVIDFFSLSNPYWLAVSLAIAFELGAAASLASLIALDKMNKTIVWILFFVITAMQMQGNMYYAFKNLTGYTEWVQLFNLVEEDPLYQKRILAFVSGAILPLVALGFIKSLVDYIKPDGGEIVKEMPLEEKVESMRKVVDTHDTLQEEIKDWNNTLIDGLENENIEETVEASETEDTAENILGLTIEEDESVEKPKAEYAKVIKNEDDLNEYLAGRSEAQNAGLVRKAPEKRNIKTLDDDRPTGFNPSV